VETEGPVLAALEIDDSTAAVVLSEAEARARASGAALEVVHVLAPGGPSARHGTERLAAEEEVRARLAAEVARALPLRDKPPVFVERGAPAAAVARRAAAERASLVVIGGRPAAERPLHGGTVAERVLRRAPCPVLVARSSPRTWRVLAATDLTDPSLPAVAAAALEARRLGARLTLVHNADADLGARRWEFLTTLAQIVSDDVLPGLERASRAALLDALRIVGAEGDVLVTHGAPAAAVLRAAHALPAELLVVAAPAATPVRTLLLGDVVEAVVRWAPCSVLAVRLHPRPASGLQHAVEEVGGRPVDADPGSP
jgi:nucleotide-binding universal stress UspA family protein